MPICRPPNGLELKAEVERHYKGHDGIHRKPLRIDAVVVHCVGEGIGEDRSPTSVHLLEALLELGFVPSH